MVTRPPVVTLDREASFFNPASLGVVTAALQRDYCPAMTLPRDKRTVRVYMRCNRRAIGKD